MNGSTIDRMRIRRLAANPLMLPTTPRTPVGIKNKLRDLQAAYESLDTSWDQWRQQVQNVLDQAIMALKLDPTSPIINNLETVSTPDTQPSIEVAQLSAEIQVIKQRLIALETQLNSPTSLSILQNRRTRLWHKVYVNDRDADGNEIWEILADPNPFI